MDTRAMCELDYGIAMSIKTLVTAMGMYSDNLQRIHKGEAIAYPGEAFEKLIEENGTHHNAVMARWLF